MDGSTKSDAIEPHSTIYHWSEAEAYLYREIHGVSPGLYEDWKVSEGISVDAKCLRMYQGFASAFRNAMRSAKAQATKIENP